MRQSLVLLGKLHLRRKQVKKTVMLSLIQQPLTFKEQIMKTAVVSRQEQRLWQEGEEISPRAQK